MAEESNYRLTGKGIDLAPALLELLIWGARHEKTEAPCAVIGTMESNREAGSGGGQAAVEGTGPDSPAARIGSLALATKQRSKERMMSKVRVLVGTRKGAFVLTSDGKREQWDVSGPYLCRLGDLSLKGSPVDPNRLYASQSTGWFGQLIQRSDDGGKTWQPMDNKFVYDGVAGTHQWYDGTPHPWEFKRVWHLEPSLTDPDTVYAGVEDAALFRSMDGGQSWQELAGLRGHGSGPHWQPGAGGMCLHTILLDPANPGRIFIAISAAGAFRTDDGGETWRPINRGTQIRTDPRPDCRGRPLRSPHCHASVAAGACCSCKSTGT